MFLCITWGCISKIISIVGDDFRLLITVNGAAQLKYNIVLSSQMILALFSGFFTVVIIFDR